MATYDIQSQNKIEEAIRLISSKFAVPGGFNKPVLLHAVRVGTNLYFNNYDTDIVIAGYLHDIIEDTDVTKQDITKQFGEGIASIVAANTKNSSLEDRDIRHEELIKRYCTQ
jgi:(p)ppGpp synthase/HD superfamily hydrolase